MTFFILTFFCALCIVYVTVSSGSSLAATDLHQRFHRSVALNSEEMSIAEEHFSSNLRAQAVTSANKALEIKYLKALFYGDGQCGGPLLGVTQYALKKCIAWSTDNPSTKYAIMSLSLTATGNLKVNFQFFKDSSCKKSSSERSLISVKPGRIDCLHDRDDQSMRFIAAPDASTYFGFQSKSIAYNVFASKTRAERNKLEEADLIIAFPSYNFDCSDESIGPGYEKPGDGDVKITGCDKDYIHYNSYSSTNGHCEGNVSPFSISHTPRNSSSVIPGTWVNFICVEAN